MAQGRPVAEAIRSIGVTEVTYYRRRSEYGGLKGDQVKRLKELEVENNRLRTAIWWHTGRHIPFGCVRRTRNGHACSSRLMLRCIDPEKFCSGLMKRIDTSKHGHGRRC